MIDLGGIILRCALSVCNTLAQNVPVACFAIFPKEGIRFPRKEGYPLPRGARTLELSDIDWTLDNCYTNRMDIWDLMAMSSAGVAQEDASRVADAMRERDQRIDALEAELRQLNRTVTGLQQELIKAGKYTHDDPAKRLEGLQWLLRRAGEYVGRNQQRGRR